MLENIRDTLQQAWDTPDLGVALGAIRTAWEELERLGDPYVLGYEEDLIDMYNDYSEDDGLPAWAELTPAQQERAVRAVAALHGNIDEYHAMVDAIEAAHAERTEEVAGYLVDLEGDDDHSETRGFDGEGRAQ